MTKKLQATEPAVVDRLLPMTKVMDLTSLSKATVYRKVADGSFPAWITKSHKLTGTGIRASATQNLFDIVKRYWDNCPDWMRPSTGNASAKELFFNKLDSGYKVGTAATKGTGRSATIQYFHGSECAFWPHADDHIAGVLQAVPDAPGSEIILESTANGVGGTFHSMWRDAETPGNEFIAIFVPWFWQDEYARPIPVGFALDEEEKTYARLYGLPPERMTWRRIKIAELRDPALFKQEYPANAAEAFQQTGHDSFIRPALIADARKATREPSGPLVVGFDPAWKGDARHSMAFRRGPRLVKVVSKRGLDSMQSAGWAKQVIDQEKPARMFIDEGGVGVGAYDRLVEMGYGDIVRPVNFGFRQWSRLRSIRTGSRAAVPSTAAPKCG